MNEDAEDGRSLEVFLLVLVETGIHVELTPESSCAYAAVQEAHTASWRALRATLRAYRARAVADTLSAYQH